MGLGRVEWTGITRLRALLFIGCRMNESRATKMKESNVEKEIEDLKERKKEMTIEREK